MPDPGVRDEDDLEELPPLDGDSSDPPEADTTDEDVLEDQPDDATLDDATGEDDPPDTSDLDLDAAEGGWLNEGAEAQDLNLGDSAIVDFGDEEGGERLGRGPNLDDDLGVGDEDFGFGNAPERGGLDAGDEGPLDADEELREADLPALDADEEGELDDAALVDAAFASDEPLGLPWADRPWSRVGAPVALVGATAVACIARGALVTAQFEGGASQLVRLDLEGTCDRIAAEGLDPSRVRALTVDGNQVVTVTDGARLFISLDGGQRFAAVTTAESIAVSDAVLSSGRLWLRTESGGLMAIHPMVAGVGSAEEPGHPLMERFPVPGVAAALTQDSSKQSRDVVVLVVDDRGQPSAVMYPAAVTGLRREAIEAPDARRPTLFASRNGHMAYAARRGGVVRRTSGANWNSFVWDGRVTAMSFIDDEGTLVASTYSDTDDTTALVRLDSSGNALVVARIGALQADAKSDGLVVAMAHDEARGVVWVAGGFGVSAFSIN